MVAVVVPEASGYLSRHKEKLTWSDAAAQASMQVLINPPALASCSMSILQAAQMY